MSAGASKRVVAEMRFGEDRAGVAKIGGRSIHQYWSLLSPHFRDVFLAPQRRSDDGGVSWTWREPAEKKAPTAAELAALRGRLERAKESFEENPVNPLVTDVGGGASSQEIIDQLTARVKSVADRLATLPDAALSEYVCRTETGVMVHSWGLAAAAKIFYPDSLESGVEGVVLVGGKGSAGNEVAIENAKGLRVARTVTDEAGTFGFGKLAPGRYRVRVLSGPGEFSSKGETVSVERGETTRIELRSKNDPVAETDAPASEEGTETSPAEIPGAGNSRKRRPLLWIFLAALAAAGGGAWFLFLRTDDASTRATQRISTLTPEKFSQARPAARPGSRLRTMAGAEGAATVPAGSPGAGSSGPSVPKIGTRVELSGISANAPGGAGIAGGIPSEGFEGGGAVAGGAVERSASENAGGTPVPAGQPAPRTADSSLDGKTGLSGGPKREALKAHAPAGVGGALPDSPAGEEVGRKPGEPGAAGSMADKNEAGASGGDVLPITGGLSGAAVSGGRIADTGKNQTGAPPSNSLPAGGLIPVAAVSVVEKPAKKTTAASTGAETRPDEPVAENAGTSTPSGDVPGERQKPRQENEVNDATTAGAAPVTGAGGSGDVSGTGGIGAAVQPGSEPHEPAGGGTGAGGSSLPTMPPLTAQPLPVDKVSERPLPAGQQLAGVFRIGAWRLVPGRDAIVPTFPVREGEKDFAESLRSRMLDEQSAHLPETLRRPRLQGGIVFRHAAGAKPQPLRWSRTDLPGLRFSLEENRAELGWELAQMPAEFRATLVDAGGVEIARVERDLGGDVRVTVRPELRAVLWIGVKYAEAESVGGAIAARFAWQVERGPLAASAWSYDSRWMDGAGCRLEVVLNGANPAGTQIALTDQMSGWQVATALLSAR